MISDRQYQMRNLEVIFRDASFSPMFLSNRKYPVEGIPRIAYSDVVARRYIIRSDLRFGAGAPFWDEPAPVVIQYSDLEELVDDGWRLD